MENDSGKNQGVTKHVKTQNVDAVIDKFFSPLEKLAIMGCCTFCTCPTCIILRAKLGMDQVDANAVKVKG